MEGACIVDGWEGDGVRRCREVGWVQGVGQLGWVG